MNQLVVPIPDVATVRKWVGKAILVLVVLYVVYVVREIWLPLGLALLLATVLDPVVDRMERKGWKRGHATIFIFGAFLAALAGLIALATPFLSDQVAGIRQGFSRYFPDTRHEGLVQAFKKMNASDGVATIGVKVFEGIQSGFQRSSTWLTEYGMSVLSNLIWVVIVPLIAFYALRDYHLILAKSLLLVPKKNRATVEVAVSEVTAVFAKYLRGLLIVSALNGTATWLLLWVLHVPSALLLGFVAGILYSVPYVGAMLTIVLTAAVAFVGGGLPMLTTAVVASVILHQIVFDQIISPRILGGQVGLHPIISIVALLIGNLLLGIVGMILAVPVAACIQLAVLALQPKLAAVEIPESGEINHAQVVDLIEETKEIQDIAETDEEKIRIRAGLQSS